MKEKLALIIILLIGFALRSVFLDISPPGFNNDEAALGYNAYSLIKTGKDEWGETLPLVFKSFSDYKPGLYVYLTIPFVYFFGLTEWAVRLPSILLGTFSIFVIYLLAKALFKNYLIVLSSALLLAISPWHIHYSRGAWETNIATFFILLGIYFFILGLNRFKWFYLSSIVFILGMYSYQSPRLLVPLLVIYLFFAYYKKTFRIRIIKPLILAIILLIPLGLLVFNNKGLARFQGVSIFTDIGPLNRVEKERGEHSNSHSLAAVVYHNKYSAYLLNFLDNYSDHFTPDFLFIKGDPLGRNQIPGMGQLYLFEIFTMVMGLIVLLRNRYNNTRFIWGWLVIGPIAASLTYQTPHALRAHNMVIPLTLISGVGMGTLIQYMVMQRGIFMNVRRVMALFILCILVTFFVARFLHLYFLHLPTKYGLEWEYGFNQLVPYVMENKDKYEKVVITNRYDQPYIMFLFYSKYDPKLYQQNIKPTGIDKYGFSTIDGFDKFEFREIKKDEVAKDPDTMYVGSFEEIKADINVKKEINFPNGEAAFRIIGSK